MSYRAHHRYDDEGLASVLQRELGVDTTLGSDRMRCVLMLGLRNATTDSPWPLSNNPRAAFNDPSAPGSNLDMVLWQLVRASTAAPTYFPSERIAVGEDTPHIFTDGGVTTLNNPALQLFLMATLPAYRLGWPTGRDRLLLVSVGTGSASVDGSDLHERDMHLLYHATRVPLSMLHSVGVQQDFLCRVLGECRSGPPLDAELGDLLGGAGLLPETLFTYVRYEASITPDLIDAAALHGIPRGELLQIDNVARIPEMRVLGAHLADELVDAAHLSPFL